MSATSGSDEPIVEGMVMVTSADRETTVLLPVMVCGVARRARLRLRSIYVCIVAGYTWVSEKHTNADHHRCCNILDLYNCMCQT